MSSVIPPAPSPARAKIPLGTRVELDPDATFVDRDLISGGSPWRLLRLKGSGRSTAEKWRGGGVVSAGEERLARTLVQQGLVHPTFEYAVPMSAVDVVIPAHEYSPALRSLIEALEGFSITVVDDGSKQAALLAALCNEHSCRYLRLENNSGPAAARNAGARHGERELIWFLDADVALDDAPALLRTLSSAFGDPLVASVAPRVRGPEGDSAREHFEHFFSPLDMGEKSGLVVPNGPIGYVPSAVLLVRRDAFGDGFDETLRVGEDVDFVWRVHDAGWLIRYDASAVAWHLPRSTWWTWWRQREGYGVSTSELAIRHGDRLAPLRADQWTLIAWLSVLFRQPSVGARIVRAAEQHAQQQFFADADDPSDTARSVVTKNMVRAGGPLARGVVRTFGVVVLAAALHPRLRRKALALFAAGTAWRWRHTRLHLRDIPLAVADDLAYGAGVLHGVVRTKTTRALRPTITRSAMSVREVLGIPAKENPIAEASSSETYDALS